MQWNINASSSTEVIQMYPDSKVHGANMGPIWGRQGPGGPHVGPMNPAIWVLCAICTWEIMSTFYKWLCSQLYEFTTNDENVQIFNDLRDEIEGPITVDMQRSLGGNPEITVIGLPV